MKAEDVLLKNGEKILKGYFFRYNSEDKWRKVKKGYIGRIYNCDLMYKVRKPMRQRNVTTAIAQIVDSTKPMIKKSNRLCCICGKPIAKGHKFFFNNECKVQHRNCDDPTQYKCS